MKNIQKIVIMGLIALIVILIIDIALISYISIPSIFPTRTTIDYNFLINLIGYKIILIIAYLFGIILIFKSDVLFSMINPFSITLFIILMILAIIELLWVFEDLQLIYNSCF